MPTLHNCSYWKAAALLYMSFSTLQHAGNVAGQFIPAPPTCPGSTITFRCTVNGSGTTLWRVDGSSNICTLVHLSTSTDTCGPSGKPDAFTAIPGTGFGTSNHSFTSTLSSTVTTGLNGTLVECFGPLSSLESGNRVGSSIIQVLGSPSIPLLSCVDLSEDVSGDVNVTLSWTLSGEDSADSYLINITTNAPQTPYGGLLNITTASVTHHKLTGFMTGYEYNITVYGTNCGSLVGRESEPLRIKPKVPAVSSNCNSALSYNQLSKKLLLIISTWDSVPDPDPGEACPGISGNITQYQIRFQAGSVFNTENVNIARCTAGRCSHTFEPPSNPPSSYDSVSVAAENVVGVGAVRAYTTQTISTTNNLLNLEVTNVSSPADTQFQCTFLSGFTGSAHCTVQYGTDPTYMNLPYSAESTETGTAGDSVSVVLRERLNSSTVYYYTVSAVSGGVTVTVQGNFTTPQYYCPPSELQMTGSFLDDNQPQCQQDHDTVTSITIPNGVVNVTCYSGRQFVSVASHVCDEGYQPNATSTVRVCRDNGLWSGTTIACDIAQTTPSTGAAIGITAVVTGFIALIVGILTGVWLHHCIINHQRQTSKHVPSSHQQHQQTVSSSNPLQQTGPEYEEIMKLGQNMAYKPVQTMELRKNEAYGPVEQ